MTKSKAFLRGDTLIEVIFAFSIFSAVSVITISAMNSAIGRAQGALELTLARTEIDAQAEALRFLHNSYVGNLGGEAYTALWKRISELSQSSSYVFPDFTTDNCNSLYDSNLGGKTVQDANAFVVNTRGLAANLSDSKVKETVLGAKSAPEKFMASTLYPRVVYTKDGTSQTTDDSLQENATYKTIARAEGIYDIGVAGADSSFYDFYIYTCWSAPGSSAPSTIGTVIRLYNPGI